MLDANGVPGPDTLVFADDDAVAPGTRFNLGAFPAGSRLEFFILQNGGARLAGDGQAWTSAAAGGGGGFAVAFEDLLADAALNPGGLVRDGDFDDVVFNLDFGAGPPAAAGTARAVFGADDGLHGAEPWITDGTAEGTQLLRDIAPGTGTSSPGNFAALGGGRALFGANDGATGPEPWITDGTREARACSATSTRGRVAVPPATSRPSATGGRCSAPTTASTAASCGSPTAPRRAPFSSSTSTRGRPVALLSAASPPSAAGGRCSAPPTASPAQSPGSPTAPRRAPACSATSTRGRAAVRSLWGRFLHRSSHSLRWKPVCRPGTIPSSDSSASTVRQHRRSARGR